MIQKPHLILLTSTRGSVWQRSIGAYQIAHHCRQNGFRVQVIDFTDFFDETELDKIFDRLVGPDLKAIGYSSTFYSRPSDAADVDPAWIPVANSDIRGDARPDPKVRKAVERIKALHPNVKIIAGGANSWQMTDDPLFDVVFHGYSDQAVVDFLNGSTRIWPKQNGKTIIDGDQYPFNIEKLSHRWLPEDVVLHGETLPIEIARGCIFKCRFCSYPLNGKKKLDYLRDVEEIKQELIDNYNNYGTTNYFFTDDTFNDSTFKLEQLHKAFTSLPFKIKFVCYLRADLLHRFPEQIPLLLEMGLGAVVFGIETFHPTAAKAIGKGMSADKLKPFLLDLYYNQWKEQVSITCSMIVGLPGESKEHLRATHQWFRDQGVIFNDNWWPLKITTKGHYKAEFDQDWDKWGYTMNEDGNWTSEFMTHDEAFALSEEFNEQGLYGGNAPGSWLMFALLSFGYPFEELQTWQNKNLPWKSLIRKKLRMVQDYKKTLYNVLEIS